MCNKISTTRKNTFRNIIFASAIFSHLSMIKLLCDLSSYRSQNLQTHNLKKIF